MTPLAVLSFGLGIAAIAYAAYHLGELAGAKQSLRIVEEATQRITDELTQEE